MGVPSPANNAELLRYAVPVFLMSMAGHFSTEIDTLMIGLLLDDRATGVFGLPKQLVAYLPHVSMAFSMGVVPALARDAVTHPAAALRRFRRFLALLGLLYALLVAGGTAAAPVDSARMAARRLRGIHRTLHRPAALRVLHRARTLHRRAPQLLRPRGEPAAVPGLTIALNIVLNLFWIPTYGVTGAAAASSVAMLPYFLLNWRRCERMLKQAGADAEAAR
jgi:O-antigen/teichoic acid export membrane protein